MNEVIIFKSYSGSMLYGTNNENSDKDFKGVFLPKLNDLILGKAPKHYTSSTGESNNKNTKDDVDETYYSLQYFLELAAKGDTNAIDLLFAYTNYEKVIIDTPIWSELIENIDRIITKNVKAYLGYCKSQCIKYSVKGDKLKNYIAFKELLETEMFLNICGESYTLKEFLDKKLEVTDIHVNLSDDIPYEFIDKFIPKPGEERIKFTRLSLGDHCYFETAQNKESFLVISDVKFLLTEPITSAYHKVNNVIASYGKRAEASANNNGVDWKAISHCVRVLLQVEELLTTNRITFPLKDAEFIKSIKYNTTNMSYDEIMNYIEEKINLIDNKLLPESTLREKADYKWIDKFVLKCYKDLYF